jgi:sec-independent protein translocase protein TatA
MIGTQEIIIILLIVLILFGGRKLPELARGVGKSLREFREASSEVEKTKKAAKRK